MYIWEPYEQILGIYPIRSLNGPYIGYSNLWDPEIKLK